MKKTIQVLGIMFLAVFVFAACSKSDNPVDNDIFVGTYKGKVSYKDGDKDIPSTDGSVTVVKFSGDTYNFKFSNGIPDINGVKITKGESGTIIVSSGLSGVFTISASKLTIAAGKDGALWTADCTR